MTDEVFYARSGEAHLAYAFRGDGPVDLLFPSYGTISFTAFDDEARFARFLDRLAGFTRLVLYDTRGVGLSDPISPTEGTTVEQEAEDAAAVLEAVGASGAAVYGTFGLGPAMIMLAASRPDLVSTLILDNTFARLVRAPDYPHGIPIEVLEVILQSVVDTQAPPEAGAVLGALAPNTFDDPSLSAWWEDAGRRGASPRAADALSRMRFRADVRDVLAHLRAQTLVLHRRHSRYIRLAHGEYLAENIPNARLVALEGADQMPFTDCADEVLGEVEEFLTGERPAAESDRVLATVLFTDIVDSTVEASRRGDAEWRVLLDRHDAMVRRQIDRFDGREVKTTGDGFLATFTGPGAAVRCAVAVTEGAAQLGLAVRAGAHTGEVEMRGDDVGGIAVHIADRVCGLAGAGQVLVSSTVRDLVTGSGLEFADRGTHVLKGVDGQWSVVEVV